VPSGDPVWFQYIDEQDMILDVSGLGLDLVTSGLGGRVTNSIEVVGRALDQTDAAIGAFQTINDYRSRNADWYTYSSLATDIAGLYIPIAPDVVGIGLNIAHAHQLADLNLP
jgi:hypothetical protein